MAWRFRTADVRKPLERRWRAVILFLLLIIFQPVHEISWRLINDRVQTDLVHLIVCVVILKTTSRISASLFPAPYTETAAGALPAAFDAEGLGFPFGRAAFCLMSVAQGATTGILVVVCAFIQPGSGKDPSRPLQRIEVRSISLSLVLVPTFPELI